MKNNWIWVCAVTLAGGGLCSDWANAENAPKRDGQDREIAKRSSAFDGQRTDRVDPGDLDGLIAVETLKAGTALVSVEVVNQSARKLDLSGLLIAASDGARLTSPLRLVRGGFALETCGRALILANPQVDVNDIARMRYDNLSRVEGLSGDSIDFSGKGIAIIASTGTVVDQVGTNETDVPGQCCDKNEAGFMCNQTCQFCGNQNMCVNNVSKNFCCLVLSGCCFEAQEVFCYSGPPSYCTGTDHQCCN